MPTILHMLLSSPKVKEVNLKGWKLIIGGSALQVGPHSRSASASSRVTA